MASDLVGRFHALSGLDDEGLDRAAFADLPLFPPFPDTPASWTNPRILGRSLAFLERKDLMTPAEFSALADKYRSAGFSISGVQNKQMLRVARDSLQRSVGRELSSRGATRALQQAFSANGYGRLRPWHARLVSQMNHSSAYNHAQWVALKDRRVEGLLPFFRYLTRGDAQVRPAHAAMHNKFYRRDHEIWNEWWPPNGFACRCKVRGVTAATVKRFKIKNDNLPSVSFKKKDGTLSKSKRRAVPDAGFTGNPGTILREQAGKAKTKAVRKARGSRFGLARAGWVTHEGGTT